MSLPFATTPFTWRDGERRIHFGRGVLADAVEHLGGPGYTLLGTERACGAAPGVAEAAGTVHLVGPGAVDALAAELLEDVAGERLVALGGGRVIDVTKALAAVSGGRSRAMAVPTTLSGAEMTSGHRLPAGADPGTPGVRPAVVVADPALLASQPEPELAASALNALGHAAEGPCTPLANPVGALVADEAARLIAAGFAGAAPDRDGLALAALLGGYAIDSMKYGLHHVLSQTLVRTAGIGHGTANAIMLPHSLGALAWRFPGRYERLAEALGGDPADVAAALRARTGANRLSEVGVRPEDLAACADAAAARPDLALTPPPADRAELLALYERAL